MTSAATPHSQRKHAALLALAFLSAMLTVTGIAGSAPDPPLVTKTPTHGATVAGSIPWQVSASGTTPARVEFAVDGRSRWTEKIAPYDFNGTPDGLLDTTDLSDGAHELSATSFAGDGSKLGTTSVTVTVANAGGTGSGGSGSSTGTPTDDLARGRTATASSAETSGLTAEKAVDGNSSTRWSSEFKDNQWWSVDLGAKKTIDTVAINWETAYGKTYKIQTSLDGTNYTDALTVDNASAGRKVSTFPARDARYVRIYGLTRGTKWGFSFWDVNVYRMNDGAPGAAPVATAPPEITGTARVGSQLQATTGTWTPEPATLEIQWQRCGSSSGASCSDIPNATDPTYTATSADVGFMLRVRVTASNQYGSTTEFSAPTAAVLVASTGAVGSKLPSRMSNSSGAQFYVSGSGSDSNPGSQSAPWRTINHAWATVPAGSVINVRGGTYSGQVNLTNRVLSASNPITVRAYPGESVRLTNSVAEYPAVYIWNSVGVRVSGFEIAGSSGDGIKVSNSWDVEISGNDIHGNAMMGILVGGGGSGTRTYSKNVQIWGNRLHGNGGYWPGGSSYALVGTHGIYYGNTGSNSDGIRHGAVGGVIANNLFYDQAYGYHIEVGSQNDGLIVTNNTFDRATQSKSGNAIQIYSEPNQFANKNVVVVNNIIANDANRGVHGAGPTMTSNVVTYNLAYNNPLGHFVPQWGSSTLFTVGPGNITGADPRFVNAAAKDFRLAAGSPGIDAANAAYAPSADFSGKGRNGPPDLGAFEH